MIRLNKLLVAFLGVCIAGMSFQPADAANSGRTMTYKWCRDQVAAKGIADTTQIKAEIGKCMRDPTTYK